MVITRIDSMETPCYCRTMTERYMPMVNAWSQDMFRRTLSPISIDGQAVERCQQRVAAVLTRDEVRGLLSTMVSAGRTRIPPRKWTKRIESPAPRMSLVKWSDLPDVCGSVVTRILVMVLIQDKCRTSRVNGRHCSPSGLHRRRQRHIDEERFLSGSVKDTR